MATNALHKRLAYLCQISELMSKDGSNDSNKMSSYYGHVSREISLKHQVSSCGWSEMKRRRCNCCHAYLSFPGSAKFAVKKKRFTMECQQCGEVKKYKVSNERKTYYEKQIYKEQDKGSQTSAT
ncbi:hypothetical protein HDE_13900 [Halotydeus destructor]|nr:hypothetical protein HDE_13900 [Halotydeus destructor]